MKLSRQQRRSEERRLLKLARKNPAIATVTAESAASASAPTVFPESNIAASAAVPALAPELERQISQTKLEANRRNAQLSTGARTPEGRATSARNNFRHGFTGAFCLLPCESQADYDRLFDALSAEYQPTGTAEEILVTNMARHQWLTQRALRLQENCFEIDENGLAIDEKKLSLYMRYLGQHERAFHKCLNDLLRLRSEARREQRGFESQKDVELKRQWAGEMHSMRLSTETMRQLDLRMQMHRPLISHTPDETVAYRAELEKGMAGIR